MRAVCHPVLRLVAASSFVAVTAFAAGWTQTRPASAAGAPNLDRLITKNPVPGWTSASSVESSELSQNIETEFAADSPTETFSAAADAWQSPQGSAKATLAIFVVEAIGGQPSWTAKGVALNFCDGVTGQNPPSAPAVAGIASSAVTSCAGDGLKATVGTATSDDLLVIVASTGTGPLARPRVAALTTKEFDALPQSTVDGGGGLSDTALAVGTAAILVAIAAVVALVTMTRRSSRRTEPPPPSDADPPSTGDDVDALAASGS